MKSPDHSTVFHTGSSGIPSNLMAPVPHRQVVHCFLSCPEVFSTSSTCCAETAIGQQNTSVIQLQQESNILVLVSLIFAIDKSPTDRVANFKTWRKIFEKLA